MQHLNVIIHFLAVVSGGYFFALAGGAYRKSKAHGIKVLIMAECFLTLILLMDSLDLYTRKNAIAYYDIINEVVSAGSLVGGGGLLYCLFYAASRTGRKPDLIRTIVAWLATQQRLMHICLAFSALSVALLLAVNVSDSLPAGLYQVPYSPILYCLMNWIGVMTLRCDKRAGKIRLQSTCVTNEKQLSILQERYGITERENEVIRHVVCGKGNQEISEQLFISLNTVKNHIYNIYRKMGIKSRYELISEYERLKREQ